MILVTGATGTVVSALLPLLAAGDEPVRALVRSPAGRAAVERHGIAAVEGDLDDATALERAMAGCDHLFLLSPVGPAQPQREKRAIDAARRTGVGHVVALSVMGSSHSSASAFGRWHAEVDDHLMESGTGWTILRPAGFMQTHLLPVDSVRREGTWYGMTGDGASAFVDAGDVAAVAAHVLTTNGHTGAVYEVTGPEAITMPQAAARLSEVLGRHVTYVDVPTERFRARLVAAGVPPWLVEAKVALYQSIRDGHAATVTDEVEKATGRPARRYRDFAGDNKDAFAVT